MQKVQLFSDLSETDFLEMAGSMEQNSQHPLGQAVVNYVKEKGLSLKLVILLRILQVGVYELRFIKRIILRATKSLWKKVV